MPKLPKHRFHVIRLDRWPDRFLWRTVTEGCVQYCYIKFYPQLNLQGEEYDGSLEGERLLFNLLLQEGKPRHIYGQIKSQSPECDWPLWATDDQWIMDQREGEEEAPMLINLTPHPIVTKAPNGKEKEYPPVGPVARVVENKDEIGLIDDVPLYRMSYGKVEGLPRPLEGCWMVVSSMVRQALPERRDLISPGELVRDDLGRVIACKAFYTNG